MSSNAVKHGLSIQIHYRPDGPEVEALAATLVGNLSDPLVRKTAYVLAESTFALKHFQDLKLSLLEVDESANATDENGCKQPSNAPPLKMMRTMAMLNKLQRYERRVLSRQWRALMDHVIATDGIEEVAAQR